MPSGKSAAASIRILATPELLAAAAAEFILQQAQARVGEAGRFLWMLSGGQTPQRVYQTLAQAPWRHWFPWEHTDYFWSDERWVSAKHPESNAGQARRCLLDHVPAPKKNIFPMPAGKGKPEEAARQYEHQLRRALPTDKGENHGGVFPQLDLILLGLGADGHIASLFPGDQDLAQETRWVRAVEAPAGRPPGLRLTVTLPVINQARQIIFLVTGHAKRQAVAQTWAANKPDPAWPATYIRPSATCHWFIDQAADPSRE